MTWIFSLWLTLSFAKTIHVTQVRPGPLAYPDLLVMRWDGQPGYEVCTIEFVDCGGIEIKEIPDGPLADPDLRVMEIAPGPMADPNLVVTKYEWRPNVRPTVQVSGTRRLILAAAACPH